MPTTFNPPSEESDQAAACRATETRSSEDTLSVSVIVQLMGNGPVQTGTAGPESQLEKCLQPYIEAAIKRAFHPLFPCVSDPLKVLD